MVNMNTLGRTDLEMSIEKVEFGTKMLTGTLERPRSGTLGATLGDGIQDFEVLRPGICRKSRCAPCGTTPAA